MTPLTIDNELIHRILNRSVTIIQQLRQSKRKKDSVGVINYVRRLSLLFDLFKVTVF
jgi:hypothetical protein